MIIQTFVIDQTFRRVTDIMHQSGQGLGQPLVRPLFINPHTPT